MRNSIEHHSIAAWNFSASAGLPILVFQSNDPSWLALPDPTPRIFPSSVGRWATVVSDKDGSLRTFIAGTNASRTNANMFQYLLDQDTGKWSDPISFELTPDLTNIDDWFTLSLEAINNQNGGIVLFLFVSETAFYHEVFHRVYYNYQVFPEIEGGSTWGGWIPLQKAAGMEALFASWSIRRLIDGRIAIFSGAEISGATGSEQRVIMAKQQAPNGKFSAWMLLPATEPMFEIEPQAPGQFFDVASSQTKSGEEVVVTKDSSTTALWYIRRDGSTQAWHPWRRLGRPVSKVREIAGGYDLDGSPAVFVIGEEGPDRALFRKTIRGG